MGPFSQGPKASIAQPQGREDRQRKRRGSNTSPHCAAHRFSTKTSKLLNGESKVLCTKVWKQKGP